jgi:hypothetical protein
MKGESWDIESPGEPGSVGMSRWRCSLLLIGPVSLHQDACWAAMPPENAQFSVQPWVLEAQRGNQDPREEKSSLLGSLQYPKGNYIIFQDISVLILGFARSAVQCPCRVSLSRALILLLNLTLLQSHSFSSSCLTQQQHLHLLFLHIQLVPNCGLSVHQLACHLWLQ